MTQSTPSGTTLGGPAVPNLESHTADPDAVRELVQARYRTDDVPELGAVPETIALQLAHRSVRAFLPGEVAPQHLQAIVAAAQSAASSSNQQSWSVVAVTDPERRARLAGYTGSNEFIKQAPLFLVWLADLDRAKQVATEQGFAFDGAEFLEATLVSSLDAALAAQNGVLAAEALGYGTVYVGGIRNRPLEVAKELALPPHVFAVFGLAVGIPDPGEAAGIKPRLPLQTVLHHEQYDREAAAPGVAGYEDAHADYYRQFGQERSWRYTVARRWTRANLHGRDRLREVLEQLGWPSR